MPDNSRDLILHLESDDFFKQANKTFDALDKITAKSNAANDAMLSAAKAQAAVNRDLMVVDDQLAAKRKSNNEQNKSNEEKALKSSVKDTNNAVNQKIKSQEHYAWKKYEIDQKADQKAKDQLSRHEKNIGKKIKAEERHAWAVYDKEQRLSELGEKYLREERERAEKAAAAAQKSAQKQASAKKIQLEQQEKLAWQAYDSEKRAIESGQRASLQHLKQQQRQEHQEQAWHEQQQSRINRRITTEKRLSGVIESNTHRRNLASSKETAAIARAETAVIRKNLAQQQLERSNNKTILTNNKLSTSYNKVAQAVGTALTANEIKNAADQYVGMRNKLNLAVTATADLNAITKQTHELANRTRSEIGAVATLYSRMAFTTKQLNLTQNQLVVSTETLSKSFKTGGATAAEAASLVTQFTQALSKGRLDGDELRSVMENNMIVTEALAKELGVTTGELKKLGSQGKITSDIMINALLNSANDTNQAFSKLETRFDSFATVAKNNFSVFVGESLVVRTTLSAIGYTMVLVSENLDVLVNAMGVAAVAAAFRYVAGITAAAGATTVFEAVVIATAGSVSFLSKAMTLLGRGFAMLGGWPAVIASALAYLGYELYQTVDAATAAHDSINDLNNLDFDATANKTTAAIDKITRASQKQVNTFEALIKKYNELSQAKRNKLKTDIDGAVNKTHDGSLDLSDKIGSLESQRDNEIKQAFKGSRSDGAFYVEQARIMEKYRLKIDPLIKEREALEQSTDKLQKAEEKLLKVQQAATKDFKLFSAAIEQKSKKLSMSSDEYERHTELQKAAKKFGGDELKVAKKLINAYYDQVKAIKELDETKKEAFNAKVNNIEKQNLDAKFNAEKAHLAELQKLRKTSGLDALSISENQTQLELAQATHAFSLKLADREKQREMLNLELSALGKNEVIAKESVYIELKELDNQGLLEQQYLQEQLTEITQSGIDARKQIQLDNTYFAIETAALEARAELYRNHHNQITEMAATHNINDIQRLQSHQNSQLNAENFNFEQQLINLQTQREKIKLQLALHGEEDEVLRQDSILRLRDLELQEENARFDHEQRKTKIESDGVKARERLRKQEQQSALRGFGSFARNMLSAGQNNNKTLFEIGKRSSQASALVNGIHAGISAWKWGMDIGGPWTAAAFAGASALKTGSELAALENVQYNGGGGGSSSGGASPSIGGSASIGSSSMPTGGYSNTRQANQTTQTTQEVNATTTVVVVEGLKADDLITGQQLIEIAENTPGLSVVIDEQIAENRRLGG